MIPDLGWEGATHDLGKMKAQEKWLLVTMEKK
jgi:hypothetical protein